MRWSQVNQHRWRKVRAAVLLRDAYKCRIRLPGCTGIATQVDHIIPLHQGGMVYDPNNLRGACQHCNRYRETPTPRRYDRESW